MENNIVKGIIDLCRTIDYEEGFEAVVKFLHSFKDSIKWEIKYLGYSDILVQHNYNMQINTVETWKQGEGEKQIRLIKHKPEDGVIEYKPFREITITYIEKEEKCQEGSGSLEYNKEETN